MTQKIIVKLGHEVVEIDIEVSSRAQAIKIARKVLCERWPRLWDVIMKKSDGEFECQL